MWLTIFALAFAGAIFLTVSAFIMQHAKLSAVFDLTG
jgi:hypothetical protein